jgi:hypothetical protein
LERLLLEHLAETQAQTLEVVAVAQIKHRQLAVPAGPELL